MSLLFFEADNPLIAKDNLVLVQIDSCESSVDTGRRQRQAFRFALATARLLITYDTPSRTENIDGFRVASVVVSYALLVQCPDPYWSFKDWSHRQPVNRFAAAAALGFGKVHRVVSKAVNVFGLILVSAPPWLERRL